MITSFNLAIKACSNVVVTYVMYTFHCITPFAVETVVNAFLENKCNYHLCLSTQPITYTIGWRGEIND